MYGAVYGPKFSKGHLLRVEWQFRAPERQDERLVGGKSAAPVTELEQRGAGTVEERGPLAVSCGASGGFLQVATVQVQIGLRLR